MLMEQMFVHHGYHSISLDFHHQANSYLNEVIDDREGLPITLSLLLLEVGQESTYPYTAASRSFLALYREQVKPLRMPY